MRTATRQDHPRGCGENFACGAGGDVIKGSPPRMRGKPPDYHNRNRQVRITPADAGKTGKTHRERRFRRDHPRGCGENYQGFAKQNYTMGSPPRMRGKRSGFRVDDGSIRITPADAGKTVYRLCFCFLLRDHPRGCGENTKKIL